MVTWRLMLPQTTGVTSLYIFTLWAHLKIDSEVLFFWKCKQDILDVQ